MAAEVSSLVQRFSEEKPSKLQNSDVLKTKDLLGSLSKVANNGLDLQSQGKMLSEVQDLNNPPTGKHFSDETCLDLKLEASKSHSNYESVCTIDKVKHALERAQRENTRRMSLSPPSSSLTLPLLSIPSAFPSSEMFAAACPACLLYVMALNTNPTCPRCNSVVPSALPTKPRIDLNTSSF